MANSIMDPKIFDELKAKLEEESKVRQDLGQIGDELEKEVAFAQGLLSRVHSLRRAEYPALLDQVESTINKEVMTIDKLKELASKHPYYKYNHKWTRHIQDAIFTVLLTGWLGGLPWIKDQKLGHLLTIEDIGEVFAVPVNVKDQDVFHISIEEYLLAIVQLTDELSRLATNAVTLGDYELAVLISSFIKDLHGGFQLLNLKNDILRKRVDTVKYHVKKVEDVVYDLSLRNLIPTNAPKPQ